MELLTSDEADDDVSDKLRIGFTVFVGDIDWEEKLGGDETPTNEEL